MVTKAYRYDVSFRYNFDGIDFISGFENINYLGIDYDYENRNMPILIMYASLDKNIIDDMIKNQGKKHIVLTIQKYVVTDKIPVKQNYIHDEFTYFINSDRINKNEVEDYKNKENKNRKDLVKPIRIGLISERLINNNKITTNEVARNTTLMDLVCYHLSHMKLLIEPMNNEIIEEFVIPPIQSISKLLDYINKYYTFYNTGYRLFYDFDKTYLLNAAGNIYVKALGERYSKIQINISESINKTFLKQGMDIDDNSNMIQIDIPIKETSITEDKVTDKSYDKILAITPDGKHKTVKLTPNASDNNKKKTKIIKLQTSNLDGINAYRTMIESNSIMINCAKDNIDTSVFTMNKLYTIKIDGKFKDKSGSYKLVKKTEAYCMTNDQFNLVIGFLFKKV